MQTGSWCLLPWRQARRLLAVPNERMRLPMKPQAPTSVAKTEARRRLIRGSFSLPAVLAVHNGSALAARSNQFRCVLNQTPAGGGAFPGLTDNTQDWIRVARYKTSGSDRWWVRVADLTAVGAASGVGYGGPAGTSRSVTVDGNPETSFWLPWHSAADPAPALGAALTLDGSVAVLFGSSTAGSPAVVTVKVMGFVKEGQLPVSFQGATTRSCWTSIR